ncbi:MAG: hypothetical protein AAGA56_16665 [Myxococcota bacterium]
MSRALALGLFLMGAIAAVGCVTVEDEDVIRPNCGSREQFEPVSVLLENHCGSLDCHGGTGRAFAVFGRTGRRRLGSLDDRDPNYFTGGLPTNRHEIDGTFQSACGLQPELSDLVARGVEPATALTMLRKPRLDEAHKGGRVWLPNSSADLCLQSWFEGGTDFLACERGLEQP